MFSSEDKKFMEIALELAEKALVENEVPIGAVVVKDNEIIGKGYNQVIQNNDVSSHAEIIAIRDASKKSSNYRLNGTKIYSTLEPCHMCAKAIMDARISNLIFSATEPKTGSLVSIDDFYSRVGLNHKVSFTYGLCKEESSYLLKSFFQDRR